MSEKATIELDHHSADFAARRDEILRDLRDEAPIAWTESYGGYWFVTSYALITEILRQDEVFTVDRFPDGSGGITIPENPHKPQLLPGEVDGARHDACRRALNPFFTKAKVVEMREFIEQVMDEILDRATAADEVDAVDQISHALPARVVLTYLGVLVEDTWGLYQACEHAREQPTADEVKDLEAQLRAIIGDKRATDHGDVLSSVVRFEEPAFSDDDLVGLLVGVVLGAVRTTADTLTHAIEILDRDRALRARLIAEPELIPAAVEEILRTHTPVLGLARTAMADAVVGGQQIRKGDRLLLSYLSANQDEAKYEHAQEIDLERKGAPHFAFGRGTHFCLGSWLARLELQIAIGKILERMPDYEVLRDKARYLETSGKRNAWVELPVRPNV